MDFDDIGRMTDLNLAQTNGQSTEDRRKLAKRLAQDRKFATTQGQTGSWVNWGELATILGQPHDVNHIPMSKLEQMRRDPMIAFGLMFVKVPLIRASWDIKSNDPQRAAFIKNALGRIYGRLILAYCNCLDFGYSPIVKRFENDNPDWTYVDPVTQEENPVWPDKNVQALLWKAFIPLNPRRVLPRFNTQGEFAGIDYVPGSSFGSFGSGFFSPGSPNNRPADVPLDWALWATNEKDSEFGSLYGYPRIGYAFRYWWSYWYKFGLSDRAFEKWGDPPFIVFHPSDQGVDDDGKTVDFGNDALSTAEQLRSGANVAMPSSVIRGYDERQTNVREWDVKQMESTANFDALNNSFEYLDVQKLRSVMVPEQALIEGKGGTSSRNVASTFGDLFLESQSTIMTEIDDMINRYMIPQLLEANFGTGGATCTKITTGFDPKDVETLRAIVQGIINKNGEIPEVDLPMLLDQLGIPTLTHAAIQKRQEQIAAETDAKNQQQNQAQIQKLVAQAALKGHKIDPASLKGVQGLSDEELDDLIELSDDERGLFKRIFDRIFKGVEIKHDEEEIEETE